MIIDDPYFVLRLIMRYGVVASIVLGVAGVAVSCLLLWSLTSWWSIPLAMLVGAFIFLLCKSYVEIVGVIFHMLN